MDILGRLLLNDCATGDIQNVRDLLEKGLDPCVVNYQDFESGGRSPLIEAVGNALLVMILCLYDVNVNLTDNKGWSALIHASSEGYEESVQVLLEYGAKVDLQNSDGDTALLLASLNECEGIVQVLLDHRARVDVQDNHGWSALMCASQEGHEGIVRTLLDHGAQVDLQNNDGWSALMAASQEGHKGVVRALLDHGAQVDLQDKDGDTAPIIANSKGHREIVEMLLKKKLQPRWSDSQPPSAEPAAAVARLDMQKAIMKELDRINHSLRRSQSPSNNIKSTHIHTSSNQLTLKHVLRFTLPLSSVWHNMGVLLEVDDGTLKKIDHDHQKADDCLREMLREWLKQVNPRPSWEALAEAVEPFDPNKAQAIRRM